MGSLLDVVEHYDLSTYTLVSVQDSTDNHDRDNVPQVGNGVDLLSNHSLLLLLLSNTIQLKPPSFHFPLPSPPLFSSTTAQS
jgi:hypothetical protein